MNSKFILISLVIFLSMPSFVFALDDVTVPGTDTVIAEEVSEDSVQSETIANDDVQSVSNNEESLSDLHYKQPMSKRRLVKKFLLAMFLVILAPVVIYFGLPLYKRISSGEKIKVKTLDGDTPLSAPSDIESATRVFLDKTKWK